MFTHIFTDGELFQHKKNEKQGKLNSFISDNPKILKKVSDNDFKFKIEEIINAIKLYNYDYFKSDTSLKANTKTNKIIFFRDNKRQNKNLIEFTIGENSYSLDRNKKIEIDIPVNHNVLITIKNDINNSFDLLHSSENYKKCYELSLDKSNESSISRQNCNSSYLKARFKLFEK